MFNFNLFKKELTDIQYHISGWAFALVFVLVPWLFLWLLPGSYNLLDGGYADLSNLFKLLSFMLLVLIPALTMRAYSDEKRNGTWLLLLSRPTSQWQLFSAKFLAIFVFTTLCCITSLIAVVSIWQLGFPHGNLDLGQISVSYFALIQLVAVFLASGLFASSLTKSSIVSYIFGVCINFMVFYGFELLSGLFSSGHAQVIVSEMGLNEHFEETCRGVLNLYSILVFLLYAFLFAFLTVRLSKTPNLSGKFRTFGIGASLFLLILCNGFLPNISIDCTSDQRYTLSQNTQTILHKLKTSGKDFDVNVYLAGNLNSGFTRLSNQIDYFLRNVNQKSGYHFRIHHINPEQLGKNTDNTYRMMEQRGMKGIVLNETDRNGKVSSQLIYPYLEIIQGNDTLPISVLKNIPGNSAEDNLNASSENLEYSFIDAVRVFMDNDISQIAFIEGHNELPRPYVYDAEDALSKYFSVSRGKIGNDASLLSPFRVIIIAGSTQKFTEQEKYILDQYIMHGGRVLWLLDGIYYSEEQLAARGKSVAVANNTALDDLLFNYGIRINPVLLQDEQCASLMVTNGDENNPQSTVIPWYFCPLMIPSPDNAITKNIGLVKMPYSSSIDILRQPEISPKVLLTTSGNTHTVKATEEVNFDVNNVPKTASYFNQKFLITAVSLEGKFTSAFLNRMVPENIVNQQNKRENVSTNTKMIVVSASSVIRNELAGEGKKTQVVPLGFDRVLGRQFGNRDFIVNAVNWLAYDDNRIILRQRTQNLRLLNKAEIAQQRNRYVILNIIVPILLLTGFIGYGVFRRRKKYEKKI